MVRVFNLTVIIVLVVALGALGVFGALYGFGLAGYRLSELDLSSVYPTVNSFVESIEGGNPGAAALGALIAIAVVGLILLLLELKPPSPRRIRLGKGTYVTRKAVREEVEAAALEEPEVLEAKARAKALRRNGTKVKLKAMARRGGRELREIRKSLRQGMRERLEQKGGIRVRQAKVKLKEVDPRRAKVRVK